MKKRLLLIRHAQSEANKTHTIQGWLDYPLSDLGHTQAKQLSIRLKSDFEVTQIFTSPLSRTVQTATYLAEAFNLPLNYDENLKERGLGPLSGLNGQEIKHKFPEQHQAWINNTPRPFLEGMEHPTLLAKRVQSAMDTILAQTPVDTTVAVVSHGGTLNQMLKNWLQPELLANALFAFSNASLTVVDVYKSSICILTLNDTAHLGEN